MTKEGYRDFTYKCYGGTTGSARCYVKAIDILDDIFSRQDVFALNGVSLCCLGNIELLLKIFHFVKGEEHKFQSGEDSIFSLMKTYLPSYPRNRFCSSAMKNLLRYYESCLHEVAEEVFRRKSSGRRISMGLTNVFGLENTDRHGEDVITEAKTRIGQNYFRKMILSIYGQKCCVTGLNVKETLRASHIIAWKEDKKNRLNPENGLCLSATYDAAFDNHLISFDEDYKMIVSKQIRDYYTNETTKRYFYDFEGKQMLLPCVYPPNRYFLEKHREKLVI